VGSFVEVAPVKSTDFQNRQNRSGLSRFSRGLPSRLI
jgi:hypothetical protein